MIELRPIPTHRDERGWLFELFRIADLPIQMAYCVVTLPRKARGETEWHIHKKKTEIFIVASGQMLLATKNGQGKVECFLLLGNEPQMAIVPPNTLHSVKNVGSIPATLVCLADQLYDPEDEGRIPFKEFSWYALG